MLEARGAEFSRVLDLYAGTGALGVEALSRGAESADFVERDRGMCAIIEANLELTGFRGQATVCCAALPPALARVAGRYGLIFLDPPYELPLNGLLERLSDGGFIDRESTIVYEHSRRTMPPEECGPLLRIVTRAHGSTAFSLYHSNVEDEIADDQPESDG